MCDVQLWINIEESYYVPFSNALLIRAYDIIYVYILRCGFWSVEAGTVITSLSHPVADCYRMLFTVNPELGHDFSYKYCTLN